MANVPEPKRLTKAQALNLTEAIRSGLTETWRLISEARTRRAWEVLGYQSFVTYVDAEFDLAKSQAYRLLDKAAVVLELEAVTGVDLGAVVSQRAAGDVLPVIADVVADVVETVADLPLVERAAAVADVVQKHRPIPARGKNAVIDTTATPIPNKHLDGLEPGSPVSGSAPVPDGQETGSAAGQTTLVRWLRMIAVTSVEDLKAAGLVVVRDAVDRLAAADGRVLMTRAEVDELKRAARKAAETRPPQETKPTRPPARVPASPAVRREVVTMFKGGKAK